jgi:flagellar motor switch protein FliG
MNAGTQGIRKAAILVTAMERAAADRLLEQMSPDQAQSVRDAVIELGDVDPAERRRVIDEFLRKGPRVPKGCPAGIELDGPLAQGLAAPGASPPSLERAVKSSEADSRADTPFGCLREVEAQELAQILSNERPQMITLVLSHMAPQRAGSVLIRLAPTLQAEVVRRLVDLEEADPEVLREVEEVLESRLSQQVRIERPRAAGLSAVAGIVEAAGCQSGAQIMDNLATHDPDLAERLGPEPVRFGELTLVDDSSLAAILAAAQPATVFLALIGAPEPLLAKILRHFSATEAAEMRYRLENIGPTRLSDVEEARRLIEELAWRLAATQRIRLPRQSKVAA